MKEVNEFAAEFTELKPEYYYDGQKIDTDFEFENEDWENSTSAQKKKERKKTIKAYRAQKTPYDALFFALQYETKCTMADLLSSQDPNGNVKRPGLTKDNKMEHRFQDNLENDAMKQIIANDGGEGVIRAFRYMGMLKAHVAYLKGKEWEEIKDSLEDEDEQIKEEKANYIAGQVITEASALNDTLSSCTGLGAEDLIKDVSPQLINDVLNYYKVDDKITVREFTAALGGTEEEIAAYCRSHNCNPEDTRISLEMKMHPNYTKQDAYNAIRGEFSTSMYTVFVKQGQDQYIAQLSSKDKELVKKGQDLFGYNGGIPEATDNVKNWLNNGGKEELDEMCLETIGDNFVTFNTNTQTAKNLDITLEDNATEYFNPEVGDITYIRGAIKMLSSTKTGWGTHFSNSSEYEKMLKSIKDYERAISTGRAGKALLLKENMVKACKNYISGKYSERSSEFGQERFDVAMAVLSKNMEPNEYARLLHSINRKRGAKNETYQGYVNADYYKNKVKELEDLERPLTVTEYKEEDKVEDKYVKAAMLSLRFADSADRDIGKFAKIKGLNELKNALKEYQDKLQESQIKKAPVEGIEALRAAVVERCGRFISQNSGIPKTEGEIQRFNTVMGVLKQNVSAEQFETIVAQVNARRGVTKEGQNGFIKAEDFKDVTKNLCTDLNREIHSENLKRFSHENPFADIEHLYEHNNSIFNAFKPAADAEPLKGFGYEKSLSDDDFVTIAYAGAYAANSNNEADIRFGDEGFDAIAQSGKEKAINAMKEYGRGNKVALAKLIADGFSEINRRAFKRSSYEFEDAVETSIQEKMVDILKKDKELLKLAKKEGLTSEQIKKHENLKEAKKVVVEAEEAEGILTHQADELNDGEIKALATKMAFRTMLNFTMKKAAETGKTSFLLNSLIYKNSVNTYKSNIRDVLETAPIANQEPKKVAENMNKEHTAQALMIKISEDIKPTQPKTQKKASQKTTVKSK